MDDELLYDDPLVKYIESTPPDELVKEPHCSELPGTQYCENIECNVNLAGKEAFITKTKEGTRLLCGSCRNKVLVNKVFLGLEGTIAFCAYCDKKIHPLRIVCEQCEDEWGPNNDGWDEPATL